jgi:chromosomal replication initiation ATPase DnaA
MIIQQSKLNFTEERNKRVIAEIESIFQSSWEKITSKSRKVKMIEARRLYCVVLRKIFELPLATIGKLVNTHHASVLHSVKKHDIYTEIYDGYDKNYERIKKALIDKTSLEYFLDELQHLERSRNKIQEQIDNLLLTKNFQ